MINSKIDIIANKIVQKIEYYYFLWEFYNKVSSIFQLCTLN